MSTDDLRGPRVRVETGGPEVRSPQDRGEPVWRPRGLGAGLAATLLAIPVVSMEREVLTEPLTLGPFTVDEAPRRSIPLDAHPRVEKWFVDFQTSRRAEFDHLLARKQRFDHVIESNLRARGMPEELVFIPMIESQYSPLAVSRVFAVGLWQFMSPTAMQYGLRMDEYVDERRDPVRATDAALDYLGYLHDRFGGSWYLAAAAFNAGPGRLERVLNRHAEGRAWDDALFWEIIDHLPRETREYIPKMIAVSRLAREVEIVDASATVTPYRYEQIFVPGSTTLRSVAASLDANVQLIVALNPHLVQGITPPGEMFPVRVPVGSGGAAVSRLSGDIPIRRADDD